MAQGASDGSVRAGQRERCSAVIEAGAGPICGAVADRTISGEGCLNVVGVRGARVIGLVATVACRRNGGEVIVRMAGVAVYGRVERRLT